METVEKVQPAKVEATPTFQEEKFQPKGAIAFFILLVTLGLVIWYGIYLLMLDRV
jgi:hypothetical protein